jgi:hypothetical protein
MSDSNRDGIFQRTKEALQLLACSPSVQFRLLPSFVRVGDELALDFHHWQGVMIDNFSSELTPEQVASLIAIDESFSRFSRGGSDYSEEFWTDEGVRTSPDWQNILVLSARLREFRLTRSDFCAAAPFISLPTAAGTGGIASRSVR